ncbi:hypothetical protein [Streptomyces paludis]|uniref:Uncharacterized protein n=1 Tax=Streptomyces paludis TaxID=2282738 RepID=A0A345HM95_9ACTN|nr:hypothetical protein [Streptomyces paludis]AXG77819.1 hypothetical protein DVK44_09045 [Streptomyces paludis]
MRELASANTVSDCAASTLCLYSQTSFNHTAANSKITSRSTNSCFLVHGVFNANFTTRSYVNNLSVTAHLWSYESTGWTKIKNYPSGGFSSDIGINTGLYPTNGVMCMGSAHPSNFRPVASGTGAPPHVRGRAGGREVQPAVTASPRVAATLPSTQPAWT